MPEFTNDIRGVGNLHMLRLPFKELLDERGPVTHRDITTPTHISATRDLKFLKVMTIVRVPHQHVPPI